MFCPIASLNCVKLLIACVEAFRWCIRSLKTTLGRCKEHYNPSKLDEVVAMCSNRVSISESRPLETASSLLIVDSSL